MAGTPYICCARNSGGMPIVDPGGAGNMVGVTAAAAGTAATAAGAGGGGAKGASAGDTASVADAVGMAVEGPAADIGVPSGPRIAAGA